MREMAALSAALLPADKPRYLMGVGTPQDLWPAVAMGYDMFDCVLPTRNARNGSAFTSEGRISIKHSRYVRDERPLDPRCDCRTCANFQPRLPAASLYVRGEILAARALTEHNLYFYRRLMREAQAAIASGTYDAFRGVRSRNRGGPGSGGSAGQDEKRCGLKVSHGHSRRRRPAAASAQNRRQQVICHDHYPAGVLFAIFYFLS